MEPENGETDRMAEATQNMTLNEKPFSEEEKNEIMMYFKTCVVRNEKTSLIEKLKETVNLRIDIMKNAETNITESFPFYFVEPSLVSGNQITVHCQ